MITKHTTNEYSDRLIVALTKGKARLPFTDKNRGSVRKPYCEECNAKTISLHELSNLWGYSDQKVYKFLGKGMPYHNGEYVGVTGRQGTNGITQRFVCLDEVEIWAIKNRKLFNNHGRRGYKRQPNRINGRYVPATWKPRINFNGSLVEHAPLVTNYHGV